MPIFKKKPAPEEPRENPLEKMDPAIRPGGVFMAQLLMEKPCPMPSEEEMTAVLSKHLGRVEPYGSRSPWAGYAALDYQAKFKDGQGPVHLAISECDEFQADKIGPDKRGQMWDCPNREEIFAQCPYAVLANDLLGGGLEPQARANMLMDYLEALLELYPSCRAVYFLNSGKLIPAEMIRAGEIQGLDRYIRYAVNVRLFNITGTEHHIIDTLGLSLLFIEDLQYHFHSMDPNWVVGHAYNMASYVLSNNRPIKEGDTIDGIAEGRLAQDVQWKCRFEDAIAPPLRSVLDVDMGEFSARPKE